MFHIGVATQHARITPTAPTYRADTFLQECLTVDPVEGYAVELIDHPWIRIREALLINEERKWRIPLRDAVGGI